MQQEWGAPPDGHYPGKFGAGLDRVLIDDTTAGGATGNLTLDVAINSLLALEIVDWAQNSTLTLNHSVTVTGAAGNFAVTTSAANTTIDLVGNTLSLVDLGPQVGASNTWANGVITGAPGSSFQVIGSNLLIGGNLGALYVNGAVTQLSTNLVVEKSLAQNLARVSLFEMRGDLVLDGALTYINVGNGGTLALTHRIEANAQANTKGGIDFAATHTGLLAVLVETGGTLSRDSTPLPGVTDDRVKIAGAVFNEGGTVEVLSGSKLSITGQDGFGFSYSQFANSTALLVVGAGSNLSATGKYQIDEGKVKLTAGGNSDRLDGAGLFFGNTADTELIIVDATPGTPGTVTVHGPVTLAARTTTRMNYNGANNTADQLVVHGALTLRGTLYLQSAENGLKLTQPKDFFQALGDPAVLDAAFASITGNLTAVYTGEVITQNQQTKYFRVTMQ